MNDNDILGFEEKIVESFVLENFDDFAARKESFLTHILEMDKELKLILNNDLVLSLERIISLMPFPLTIVYEPYYVDRIYRDEYYTYYSKKHFGISRNTKRFIFFKGCYYKESFLDGCNDKQQDIERDLIGMVVIKPTQTIGRMLISPFLLNIPSCYVRTTKFEISVLGRIYTVDAFPLSGQDSEVMTCAEVNMWQIMEYFGSRYSDYRTLLPSEMLDLITITSDVRMLPSDGLTVEQESHLFKNSGLSPKIYYKWLQYDGRKYVETYEPYLESPSLEEILHFYVESGIPVLINLREKGNKEGINHSITCIGHAVNTTLDKLEAVDFSEEDHEEKQEKQGKILIDKTKNTEYNELSVLKSWSAVSGYVIMEDHSTPYQVRRLDNLRFGNDGDGILYEIESFVVPLYKHVFMAAEDAYKIAIDLIDESRDSIGECLYRKSKSETKEIIIRLFLTTSRAYKQFRVTSTRSLNEKVFFSQVAYPKFIWICEYGTLDAYRNHKAVGEFVIDATASKNSSPVISIRHGDSITYRGPSDPEEYVKLRRDLPIESEFKVFEENNLKLTNMKGGRHHG